MTTVRSTTTTGHILQVEECLSVNVALMDGPLTMWGPLFIIEGRDDHYYLACPCCKSANGEHSMGQGPDVECYKCATCKGWGTFEVKLP